jgi:hypothetical protein
LAIFVIVICVIVIIFVIVVIDVIVVIFVIFVIIILQKFPAVLPKSRRFLRDPLIGGYRVIGS